VAKIIFEYSVICAKCGNELDIEIRDSTPPTQLAVKECSECKADFMEIVEKRVIESKLREIKEEVDTFIKTLSNWRIE
jgi:hypothetical protein